ncbi:MAG: hypothetical protein V1745_03290 [Patescibacteria group bacterium]
MSLLVTHRHSFVVGLFGLFVSLFLHDWIVYPSLRPYGTLMLSALDLLLLGIPFVCGWQLVRTPRIAGIKRIATWIGWLFFLPFTIHSVMEIGHVAETCRRAIGCADRMWVLYPTFLYAFAGTLIFVFSLSQVSTKLILHSSKKRAFILGVCLYASAVSVFALQPHVTVFLGPSFYVDTLTFFFFTSVLFFVVNRVLDRAHRHIFGY